MPKQKPTNTRREVDVEFRGSTFVFTRELLHLLTFKMQYACYSLEEIRVSLSVSKEGTVQKDILKDECNCKDNVSVVAIVSTSALEKSFLYSAQNILGENVANSI